MPLTEPTVRLCSFGLFALQRPLPMTSVLIIAPVYGTSYQRRQVRYAVLNHLGQSAKLWTYGFILSQAHYPGDENHVAVSVFRKPSDMTVKNLDRQAGFIDTAVDAQIEYGPVCFRRHDYFLPQLKKKSLYQDFKIRV